MSLKAVTPNTDADQMDAQTPAQVPAAGWFPDPNAPGGMRWWDGVGWTEFTQPAAPQHGFPTTTTAQATPASYQSQTAAVAQHREGSIVADNPRSFYAIGFAATYLVIAVYTGIVLVGIVPALYAFRALERKERLAPVAVAAAAITILFAITHLRSS